MENGSGLTEAQRNFAVFTHLAGLLSILSGFPFAGLIAVIVMWQLKKDESTFNEEHGREAVNFQISLCIWAAILLVTTIFLTFVTLGLYLPIGILLFLGLVALNLYGSIQAALAANKGMSCRYPLSIRLIGPRVTYGGM